MKSELSFVIPVRNGQDYLAEAIQSCVLQRFKDIEIIVVDDGSSDDTPRIIEHFKKADARVRSIRLEARGRGSARNCGCAGSLAPYIAVLDADDLSDRDRAAKTLKMFREHGDCIIHSDTAIINCNSEQLGIVEAADFDLARSMKNKTHNLVHSTMAYPQSIWHKIRYDEGEYSNLGLDDWKFVLDAAMAGIKILKSPDVLSAYRQHGEGISKTRDEKEVAKLKDRYMETLNIHA